MSEQEQIAMGLKEPFSNNFTNTKQKLAKRFWWMRLGLFSSGTFWFCLIISVALIYVQYRVTSDNFWLMPDQIPVLKFKQLQSSRFISPRELRYAPIFSLALVVFNVWGLNKIFNNEKGVAVILMFGMLMSNLFITYAILKEVFIYA